MRSLKKLAMVGEFLVCILVGAECGFGAVVVLFSGQTLAGIALLALGMVAGYRASVIEAAF